MPALVKAIKEKRFKQARLLVDSGYDINDKEKESGHTALIASCLLEDEQKAYCIIKWLLRHEACTLLRDNNGLTALMHACRDRKYRIVELLLEEKELDLKAQDYEGNSALLYSIKAGDLKATKAILSEFVKRRVQGQDQANNLGETPLILAAKLGHWECCDVLQKVGNSSPHARDFKMKMTAEEWKKMVSSNNNTQSSLKCLQLNSHGGSCLEARRLYRNKTATLKRTNIDTTNHNDSVTVGKQNMSIGERNNSERGQVFSEFHKKSQGRHIIIGSKSEMSRELHEQRQRILERPKTIARCTPHNNARITGLTHSITSTPQSCLFHGKQDYDFPTRGHTSQSLRTDTVVDYLAVTKPYECRNINRSMSAPQSAYVNHVSRLRQSSNKKYKTSLVVKATEDHEISKRQKSFMHDELPKLFLALGDQRSPSYRAKATPPKPLEPELCKETNPTRKDILKRFARAGFASIVMGKLNGIRNKSSMERIGGSASLSSTIVRSRARSSSCRSADDFSVIQKSVE